MELSLQEKMMVILRVLNIFLFALLVFGVILGTFGVNATLPALAATYIFVYYWQKRVTRKKKK